MDIYRKILEHAERSAEAVLGIVVDAQGSTPQKVGAKALLDAADRQWGTLGGGLVEAEGLARMRAALASGRAEVLEYRLDETYSRDAGPICGGVMRIFACPRPGQYATAYRAALEAFERRERGALVTRLSQKGSAELVAWIAEASANGHALADAIASALTEERPRMVASEDGPQFFVEPVIAPPRLLVVGGGHVGQEVVFQAARLGFDVTVLDDRPEFADAGLFPAGVRVLSGDIQAHVAAYPQDAETYIVLVSKGHRPDAEALEACIHGGAKYIGMIGSRRKIRFLRKHFIEDGLATAAEFDRVVAPIGFDIGAITVPEIGVSIAAQLIAARRRGNTEARPIPRESETTA